MIVEVKVPSPGESIAEVEIANWLVEDGDYVEKDQEIAEIESDKATLPLIGRLAKSSHAEVFPCISCYDPLTRRYNVELLPALPELSDTDGEAVARIMNEAIEKTIMLCPAQYLWTLRYFQTRPPGEASVYD